MADTQHNAHTVNPLAIGILDPDRWPDVVGEWQVWIGPAGDDPVGSDDATLIGYGSTRYEAVAMAQQRAAQLVADLFRIGLS
jgi:hypothetical protein